MTTMKKRKKRKRLSPLRKSSEERESCKPRAVYWPMF
jgi:hypothetical protein